MPTQELSTLVHPREEAVEILNAGRSALYRLKSDRTYEDWRAVGKVMLLMTVRAAITLGRNKVDPEDTEVTKLATKWFVAWEQEGGSNLRPLSKSERWELRELIFNPEIDAFYLALPDDKRRRLNHPNAIINAYNRSLRPKPPPRTGEQEQFTEAIQKFVHRLATMPEEQRLVELARVASGEDKLSQLEGELENYKSILRHPPIAAALDAWAESESNEFPVTEEQAARDEQARLKREQAAEEFSIKEEEQNEH